MFQQARNQGGEASP